nr:hypothetical protein [Tanacetum cinerariifolium]
MDKKKKFDLNLEIFRDILQICPRVHGQNFDELPTDEDIVSFFKELSHTREIKTITDIVVDQMHQTWRTFTTIINQSLSGKTTGLDKLRLSRAHILWGMYYKKNIDYVELIWEDFAYLIDNGASPKEPTRKSKRVKRPAKKSFDAPTAGVIIRETPVKSLSKKKEKMSVKKCKGIDLLSEVALTEEVQYEEVHQKSLRDFHNTHPSGSGTVTKFAPSAAKIKPYVTNEGTGVKPWVPDVTEEESTESEAESCGRDEDDNNNDHDSRKKNEEEIKDDEEEEEDEFVKTSSNDSDDEDETKIKDKAEGDEDEGMDYTTNQFDDDVDLRTNEPVTIDEGLI